MEQSEKVETKLYKRLLNKLHIGILKFDRIFSESVWRQLFFLAGIFVVAQIIGWIVCSQLTFGESAQRMTFWEWAFYIFIDGNALNTLYMDDFPNGGRNWVMIFATLGSLFGVVVFGGMLISVFTNMLERRVENYRTGKNTYLKSNHTIILGYDEIVPSIIKKICMNNEKMFILLQSSLPSESIREKIKVSIAQEYLDRVIIKNGHRTSKKDLEELHIKDSVEVFVVGDRTKVNHDTMNIECLDLITDIIKGKDSKPHTVTAVFEDANTYAAMTVTDMFEELRKCGVEFVPYNFYVDWAKQMFVDCQYIDFKKDNKKADNKKVDNEKENKEKVDKEKADNKEKGSDYEKLDREGIAINDERHVHLVIIGASTFGVTLAVEAAKMLHFPNFDGKNNKSEITIIDKNADMVRFPFISRYRHFFEIQSYRYGDELIPATKFSGDDADFLDIDFQFVKGDVYTPEIQSMLLQWANDSKQLLSIVISMNDSRENLSIAMSLPDELCHSDIPIFVRQDSSGKFIKKLPGCRFSKIYPFGMTDIAFDVQRDIQKQAELINYYHRIKNSKEKEIILKEEKHDYWKKLKVSDQWSSIYSAYAIPFRLRSLKASGQGDIDTEKMDEELLERYCITEHNRWNVEKLLMGYRKPLPEEDAYNAASDLQIKIKENKQEEYIHCHIRPHNQLWDATKGNDRIIVGKTREINNETKNISTQ